MSDVDDSRVYEVLYRLGTTLATERDEQKLVQLVTDEATTLTGAHFGAFFWNVVDERGEAYMLYTLSGASQKDFEGFPMPRATPLFAVTFRGEGVLRCDDVRKDPRFGAWGPQPKGHLPVVSYLAVPVMARDGQVLGGLFFAHRDPGRFTEAHERIAVGIAGQAAVALENVRLVAKLLKSEAASKLADRRKDEFLAMLGHELRNPLAPIATAVTLLTLRGERNRELDVIKRQVAHLSRLVDDLLDLSRVTRGKVELDRQPVEIAKIARAALEMASSLIEQRTHHLEVDVPDLGLVVDGDAVRLAQIVSNLLTNAARYTDPGGHVTLRAWREGAEAVIEVTDDGRGIGPDLLPILFEAFVQGHRDIDRAEGGLGIGLALVKNLVAMHDGTVTASSDGPGKGSRFVVRLPAMAENAVAVASSTPSGRNVGPHLVARVHRRVLVVDDNEDAAELLAEALRELGHEVAVANDGPAALEVATSFAPDVAVLDIGLPVMDGYELAERFRATPALSKVRLIALTGYGQTSDRERAEAAGFLVHLVKPVAFDVLERAIEG